MQRIFLFIATNVAVMLVITIVTTVFSHVFGITLGNNGEILIMAVVFGFSGSLISLFMSKIIAKRSMRVQLIEKATTTTEQWLLETVRQQAKQAKIKMPEVGIFESQAMNAFATGWNRNKALVAVSSGLLQQMNEAEVEAVLAHEITHVANGDMVTLTLIQGVVNTFVYFFSTVLGRMIDKIFFKNARGNGLGYFIGRLVAQVVLSFLASLIVMWFSRWREFRADEGGANLAGRQQMIAALERLKSGDPAQMPKEMLALGINATGLKRLFSTHPSLQARIDALRKAS